MRHNALTIVPGPLANKAVTTPRDVHVQVTAEHLQVLPTFAPMETLIAMLLFYDFDVCGGAILLDGGQSDTPAKLVVEDCEFRDTQSSYSGGAIFQVGTTHLEVTRTLFHNTSSYSGGAYFASVGPT